MNQKNNELRNLKNYAKNNDFKIYDNNEYKSAKDYQEQEKDLIQFEFKNSSDLLKNLSALVFHVNLQVTMMKLKSELQCQCCKELFTSKNQLHHHI